MMHDSMAIRHHRAEGVGRFSGIWFRQAGRQLRPRPGHRPEPPLCVLSCVTSAGHVANVDVVFIDSAAVRIAEPTDEHRLA